METKQIRLASQMEQLQAQQIQRAAHVELERATGIAISSVKIAGTDKPSSPRGALPYSLIKLWNCCHARIVR